MTEKFIITREQPNQQLIRDCIYLLNKEKIREFCNYPDITEIEPYSLDSDEATRLNTSEIYIARNTKTKELLGFISVLRKNYLDNLFVSRNHSRKGIGRKLLETVLENHPNQDYYLLTSKGNNPAISLYLSLGFNKTKEFEYKYQIIK